VHFWNNHSIVYISINRVHLSLAARLDSLLGFMRMFQMMIIFAYVPHNAHITGNGLILMIEQLSRELVYHNLIEKRMSKRD